MCPFEFLGMFKSTASFSMTPIIAMEEKYSSLNTIQEWVKKIIAYFHPFVRVEHRRICYNKSSFEECQSESINSAIVWKVYN